jgi:hypothetical protein
MKTLKIKLNWWRSPDGSRRIGWNPLGHFNTNEGSHVTVKDFNGRRHTVTDKIFILITPGALEAGMMFFDGGGSGGRSRLPNQGRVSEIYGAPSVDAGKQGKHVQGHNNSNLKKSQWRAGETGVRETQEAWMSGQLDEAVRDGSVRIWDTGTIVGSNGETGVRVHIDSRGNIHGYPVNIEQYLRRMRN